MYDLPKIFKQMIPALCFIFLVGACGYRSASTGPWYDFSNAWANPSVDGARGWHPPSRMQIALAAQRRARQRRKARIRTLKSELRTLGHRTRRSDRRVRKKTKSVRKVARRSSVKTRRVSQASPVAVKVDPGSRPSGLILGDGSVPSELIAAAQRAIGMQGGFRDGSFARYLLATAAVPIRLNTPRDQFIGRLFAHLRGKGKTFSKGKPRPGDLVFFHHTEDLNANGRPEDRFTTVAVVEKVLASGTVIAMGWTMGSVRKFRMDPERPALQRDEKTQQVVNESIRRRSLSDGPIPVLAGALWAGYARF
jgi:hypothetical protein